MRTPLYAVALALVATITLSGASAEGFSGTLSARAVYLQGETQAASDHLLTHVGGTGLSFQSPPRLQISGERVQLKYDSQKIVGLQSGGTTLYQTEDQSQSRAGTDPFDQFTVDVASWLPEDSELFIRADPQIGLGQGTARGRLEGPAPVSVLAEPVTMSVQPGTGVDIGFRNPYELVAPAGWIVVAEPEASKSVEFSGSFEVYVFGAAYSLTHESGTAYYETGLRSAYPAGISNARETWLNITVLQVYNGHLVLEPNGNGVVSFADAATMSGVGRVALQSASGHLDDETDETYEVDAKDLTLVGSYRLGLQGSASGGFLAGVVGDFESDYIKLAATNVKGSAFSWWWVAVIGMAAAGGATGTVYMLRKRERPVAVVRQVETIQKPVVQPAKEGVPEAQRLSQGFLWEELNEEFGIVRAGEKGGVLIVLVPSDRVKRFVDAVVQRGLMAEDTGDRVHAGTHELAVVALEPSPVMLN